MDVEVTKLPESRVALKITLTPDEIEGALDRTYRQLVQRVNVPGFRRGKAPRAVVERMIGHEVFLHEATEEAIRWGYRKAIDQEHLVPIDEAEIGADDGHGPHVHAGEPFHLEASVAVNPDVELPDYRALQVERPAVEVADTDVEALLQEIRQRNAILEPTVRAAELGDVVTMNVVGRVGGEDVINNEEADLELREEDEASVDNLLPGLSKELVGINRGEIREISLPLPELYPNADLAGKTMFLRILIKEIRRKVLPDLNDEFAQTVSEYGTLDELRGALRSNLELERRIEAEQELASAVVDEVRNSTFVQIPPVLIEAELERMVDDMTEAFQRRHLDLERELEQRNRGESDVRAEMREAAIRNVRTSLVLGGVADAEGIEVTNAEINASLEELFRAVNTPAAERRRIRQSTGVRSNLRSRIRRQKAIRRLTEIMSGGEQVSAEAADAIVDQTAGAGEDAQETLAVEIGG